MSNYRRLARHWKEAQETRQRVWKRQHRELLKNGGYSQLCVLKSAAGYYLGELYYDIDFKFWSPGSRSSDYYRTEQEVIAAFPYAVNVRRAVDTSGMDLGLSEWGFLPANTQHAIVWGEF